MLPPPETTPAIPSLGAVGQAPDRQDLPPVEHGAGIPSPLLDAGSHAFLEKSLENQPQSPMEQGTQPELSPLISEEQKQALTANSTQPAIYVTMHGHFYQPPRENPWTNSIERQPSAAPFHNWNERILAECYRPNAFARILDGQGQVLQIVNNYEYLSFNFGPTLLSWIEQQDIEVYQRILAADRLSAQRLNGHGNAIAQVYNHIILPLASERDKRTQIAWGIADFRHRFGRQPEGMWLAETAIDQATAVALIEAGIRFTILAPSQAYRCRPIGGSGASEWQDVSQGQIDPTRPYRYYLPNREAYLDIFFFDGPISRDLGFSDVVYDSSRLSGRMAAASKGSLPHNRIIQCATDGETFGHHKKGVERTLAYALTQDFPRRGWQVSNYAHYLSQHPPTWEVQLKPVTAWSCSHGVDRWQADCGCGGGGGWHQKWRQPLRSALNWLRDQLAGLFVTEAEAYLRDPWQARDHYIEVILNREATSAFLQSHQRHDLTPVEQTDVLRLLESQRYSQLMFTSCGWFFEEISRPEGVQILRYAARAMELAAEVTGVNLEPEFRTRLEPAPSNVGQFRDGEGVYRALVQPALISPSKVAAQYAMSSLFANSGRRTELQGYLLELLDHDRRTLGGATLAVGRLKLHSSLTRESQELAYAVLHLGGWDFHCGIQLFPGRRAYEELKAQLLGGSRKLNRVELVIAIQDLFGREVYNLSHLATEERQQIMQWLTQDTLSRLNQLYRQTYLDNYSILMAFRADGLEVPEELQVAAQISLNQRLIACLQGLEMEDSHQDDHALELRAILHEAQQLGCQLRRGEAAKTLDRLLHRCLWQLAHLFNLSDFNTQLIKLEYWLHLAADLELPIGLDRLQELYLACLESQIVPRCQAWPQEACQDISTPRLLQLLQLGQVLRVNVRTWLEKIH
ncbi:MAG: DUF3536 domain-containing protein [Cyanobacteriota bacterium]|nr:DUF3536 domain-containing protein [Cyanobacteriota bacterium]